MNKFEKLQQQKLFHPTKTKREKKVVTLSMASKTFQSIRISTAPLSPIPKATAPTWFMAFYLSFSYLYSSSAISTRRSFLRPLWNPQLLSHYETSAEFGFIPQSWRVLSEEMQSIVLISFWVPPHFRDEVDFSVKFLRLK